MVTAGKEKKEEKKERKRTKEEKSGGAETNLLTKRLNRGVGKGRV